MDKRAERENYFIENYKTVTMLDMIEFIEEFHPEDRKEVAENSIANNQVNFFKLKTYFYHKYFERFYEEKIRPSDIIRNWLEVKS